LGSPMPPTASRFLRATSTLEHGSVGRSGAREAESAGAAGVRGRRRSAQGGRRLGMAGRSGSTPTLPAQASTGGDLRPRRWESRAGTSARGSGGSWRIHPDRASAGVCGGGDAPHPSGAGALRLPVLRHRPHWCPITLCALMTDPS
jgi:hypothetical protein